MLCFLIPTLLRKIAIVRPMKSINMNLRSIGGIQPEIGTLSIWFQGNLSL